LQGAGLDAPPPTNPASTTPQIISKSKDQNCPAPVRKFTRFFPWLPSRTAAFSFHECYRGREEEKMNRRFQRIRDDRFPRTASQNPLIEIRNYAELVEATQ
jgi:hypothetical protein